MMLLVCLLLAVLGGTPETCTVRTEGPTIVIEGTGERGALYGAYAFLERKLGMRWFYGCEPPTLPAHRDLTLEPFSFTETPFFRLRSYFGVEDVRRKDDPNWLPFVLFNRINVGGRNFTSLKGNFVPLVPVHDPLHHQLDFFLPPDAKSELVEHGYKSIITNIGYFALHPEWFSQEQDGRRTKRQLCFAHPGMRKEFFRNFIATVEHRAQEEGPDARRGVWAVNAMDTGGQLCYCPACTALIKKHACPGAPYFDFMCDLARTMETRYPEMAFCVSAYRRGQTLEPPKDMAFPKSVVVTWAPIDTDQSKPYAHPNNRIETEALRTWCRLARTLNRDYTWNYGGGNPPNALFGHMTSSLKTAADFGAWGAWLEHAPGFIAGRNATDMGMWVYSQLMRDPNQDWRALVREFCEGCFGAAADDMCAYIDELERVNAECPGVLRWSERNDSAYTPENLWKWSCLFDRMVEKVKSEGGRWKVEGGTKEFANSIVQPSNSNLQPESQLQLILDRINEIRAAVDNETLAKYKAIKKRHPDFPHTPDEIYARAVDAIKVAWIRRITPAKYTPGMKPKKDDFIHPGWFKNALDDAYALATMDVKPLPPAFDSIPEERIVQVFPNALGRRGFHVNMADAATGVAVGAEVQTADELKSDFLMPMKLAVLDRDNMKHVKVATFEEKDIVPDRFHLYRIGVVAFPNASCRLWSNVKWCIAPLFGSFYKPGGEGVWDVYVSLKLQGKSYSKKSAFEKTSAWFDRMVLVKVSDTETKFRDGCWLYGHDPGDHDGLADNPMNHYNCPVSPALTIPEAARQFGLDSICVCRWSPAGDDYLKGFAGFKNVSWVICGAQASRYEVLKDYDFTLLDKMPNLIAFDLDDYFKKPGSAPDEEVEEGRTKVVSAAATMPYAELLRLRDRVRARKDRTLQLQLVIYDFLLRPEMKPVLDVADIVQYWTWCGKDLSALDERFATYRKMAPDKPTYLGVYMYDYGKGRALDLAFMKDQLEKGWELWKRGEVKGFVFHCSNLLNKNLAAAEYAREWFRVHADLTRAMPDPAPIADPKVEEDQGNVVNVLDCGTFQEKLLARRQALDDAGRKTTRLTVCGDEWQPFRGEAYRQLLAVGDDRVMIVEPNGRIPWQRKGCRGATCAALRDGYVYYNGEKGLRRVRYALPCDPTAPDEEVLKGVITAFDIGPDGTGYALIPAKGEVVKFSCSEKLELEKGGINSTLRLRLQTSTLSPASVRVTRGGFLVSQVGRVDEYDATGRKIGSFPFPGKCVVDAVRDLKRGGTVVSLGDAIVELDTDGKQVWKLTRNEVENRGGGGEWKPTASFGRLKRQFGGEITVAVLGNGKDGKRPVAFSYSREHEPLWTMSSYDDANVFSAARIDSDKEYD